LKKHLFRAARPPLPSCLRLQVQCSLTEAYHYDVDIRGVRRDEAPERPPPDTQAALRPMPAEICRWD
jgi:hypothetical protein